MQLLAKTFLLSKPYSLAFLVAAEPEFKYLLVTPKLLVSMHLLELEFQTRLHLKVGKRNNGFVLMRAKH